MAKFTLRFIVPNNDDIFDSTIESAERYISSLITDFDDQRSIYTNNKEWKGDDSPSSIIKSTTLTYTYNEKISLHKNAQRELSFSMDDKVFIDNQWIQNPYARVLRNGVQVELTDKYNNTYLFTVNKIQYNLKNLNIVYNVTCQDSFTYQLNRQNSGYTLTNDETSIDFIGALDIDQWVMRIVKDCYITYQYVPLDTGIYQYQDSNGKIFIGTFEYPGDDREAVATPNIILPSGYKVIKIIKNIYNKENYKEFYETIPFSTSGTSANAALISLAETLGLQLCVTEGHQEQPDSGIIIYNRYFYFGPTKNEDTSGLTYSPKQEIQDFGLNFSGDSLTTVLNVQSTTWNEQEIGLFPQVPGIIQQVIMSPDWVSSTFYPGFFSELVQGKSYSDKELLVTSEGSIQQHKVKIDEEGISLDNTGDNYLFVPLNLLKEDWPIYYNKLQLFWDKKYYSTFTVSWGTEDQNHILSPYGNKQDILICFYYITPPRPGQHSQTHYNFYYCNEKINTFELETYFDEDTSNAKLFLCFKAEENSTFTILDLYLKLTRDYTDDEVTFAEIADQCPWLENKLIDFTYFLNQGILSRAEYENLMKWLTNDLRIINGQLMCYSAAYLQSLHEQTKILATIESDTEKVGADFMADVEVPYESTGDLKKNTSNIVTSYNNLFFQRYNAEKPTALFNLNNIITQKFNQYFSAEQRFFKNIYNFKQYFNDLNIYSAIYGKTYIVDGKYSLTQQGVTINGEDVLFSFGDTVSYKKLGNNSPVIYGTGIDSFTNETVYQFIKNQYVAQKIPNPTNYKEFYVPLVSTEKLIPTTGTDPEHPISHTYNAENQYYITTDKYSNLFKTNDFSKKTTIRDEATNTDYVLLNERELKVLYVSNPSRIDKFYVRDNDLKIPFEYIRTNINNIRKYISLNLWVAGKNILALFNCNQYGLTSDYWVNTANFDSESTWKTSWNLYKLMIPIDTLYIKDYNMQYVGNNTDAASFKILDEHGIGYEYDDINGIFRKKITGTDDEEDTWEEISKTSLYQKFYSVPFLNIKDNIISGFLNDGNDCPITVRNWKTFTDSITDGQNKYFTNSLAISWDKILLKTAASNPDDWIKALLQNPIRYQDKDATGWMQDGMSDKSLAIVNSINQGISSKQVEWKTYTNKSHLIESLQPFSWDTTDESFFGDNYIPNYVKTQNAEEQIQELTNAFVNSILGEELIAAANNKINGIKHYFNYYKYIVATYSQGVCFAHTDTEITDPKKWSEIWTSSFNEQIMDKYYIKNKYGRFCTPSTIINFDDTYLWVQATNIYKEANKRQDWIKEDDNDIKLLPDRFSLITFYPLESSEIVYFGNVFTSRQQEDKKTHTISEYISKLKNGLPLKEWQINDSDVVINNMDTNTYRVEFTIKNQWHVEYYIIHVEPYEYATLSNTEVSLNQYKPNNYQIYVGTTKYLFYNKTTEQQLKSEQLIFEAADELFYIPHEDEQLVLVSELDEPEKAWNNGDTQTTHWYTTNSLESRTYSIYQILNNSNLKYYYLSGTTLKNSDTFHETPFIKEFVLNYHTYTIDEDDILILNNKTNSITITTGINANEDETVESSIDLTSILSAQIPGFQVAQGSGNGVILQTNCTSYPISSMTNGELWYFFKDRTDIADICQKTAIIATQLTTYWQQAYNASQLCKWFIPEYWQPNVDTVGKNSFSSLLYCIKGQHVYLIDDLIPEVDIFKYNDQTLLPNYKFYYNHDNSVLDNQSERMSIEDIGVLNNNSTVMTCINDIFGGTDVLTAQEFGLTTYYLHMGKGWLRSEVLYKLTKDNKILSNLTGLYGMQLAILLNNYFDAGSSLYEKILNKKIHIWKMLYSRYPGIFLENTYKNENARSEKQLLQMAKLAFKDYTAPEKQYNITLIDAAALQGYQGQELHLGDGILIRTSDYYDEIDETYRALNQYLFISDISYDLRKDTDIALTVNTIKYQDKLLQSLVKLIR